MKKLWIIFWYKVFRPSCLGTGVTQLNKLEDLNEWSASLRTGNDRFTSLVTGMTQRYKFRDRGWIYSIIITNHSLFNNTTFMYYPSIIHALTIQFSTCFPVQIPTICGIWWWLKMDLNVLKFVVRNWCWFSIERMKYCVAICDNKYLWQRYIFYGFRYAISGQKACLIDYDNTTRSNETIEFDLQHQKRGFIPHHQSVITHR